MKKDDFDSLLRSSDPMRHDAGDTFETSRRHWESLATKRVTFRRRVRAVAALGLCLILAGGGVARFASRTTPVAVRQPVHSPQPERSRPPQNTPSTVQPTERTDLDAGQRSESAPAAATPLEVFANFMDDAGEPQSLTWTKAVSDLSRGNSATQRQAIELVPLLKDRERRSNALQLVCEAAGESRRDVLQYWLNRPETRGDAWERLVRDATFDQAVGLVVAAKSPQEKNLLCRRIAESSSPAAADVLVRLAQDASWRSAVRRSASSLNADHIEALTIRMRERDRAVRMAAAFLLSSVEGEAVEQIATSMIFRGRYRQPAYMALLSRNTPQARAFLARAAGRADLAPALVSARLHFANMEQPLRQWIVNSQGEYDEPHDTTKRTDPRAGIVHCDRVLQRYGEWTSSPSRESDHQGLQHCRAS